MTNTELQAIQKRCERALPGPWKWEGKCRATRIGTVMFHELVSTKLPYYVLGVEYNEDEGYPYITIPWKYGSVGKNVSRYHNKDFIAHAREDIPALLAEVDRLRGLLAERGKRK